MIRSSAPGRCGIVGNPTDGYGGTVVASSLAERAVVEIEPHDRIEIDVCGAHATIGSEADLALEKSYTDVARAVLLRHLAAVREHKFRLKAWTSVPTESGLAGSTAMLIAILGAVQRMLGLQQNPYEIAETARIIEFHTLDVVCGFQDQHMAVFGGLNLMDFRGKEPHSARHPYGVVEPLVPLLVAPDRLPLVLAATGLKRHSGSVHASPRERWIQGDPAIVRGYEAIAGLAHEAKKALIRSNWAHLGELMNENHEIARELGGSGDANERLIACALDAGAWGAKLAGAGKGGTIIAVHEDPEYLCRRLTDAGAVRVMPVRPSAGLTVEGEPF